MKQEEQQEEQDEADSQILNIERKRMRYVFKEGMKMLSAWEAEDKVLMRDEHTAITEKVFWARGRERELG